MRGSLLFDPIRKKRVAATPEEIVRQSLIKQLIEELGYPSELIAVEKDLKTLPHLLESQERPPKRRADLLCFGKGIHPLYPLYPLLLIECKELACDFRVREQVVGYNHVVKAFFVGIASRQGFELGYFDQAQQTYCFSSRLPTYAELVRSCKSGSL